MELTIPSTIEGYPVTTIYDGIFQGSVVRSVIIPESVTSMYSAVFYNCTTLENDIPFVAKENNVASIGDVSYKTLQNAIKAYKSGVIQLLADAKSVEISKDNEI